MSCSQLWYETWSENKDIIKWLHTIQLQSMSNYAIIIFSDLCQGFNLNCIVIRELFVCTELPNDELSSIHTYTCHTCH